MNVSGELSVAERFVSIQGESGYAGLTCFFIRLAGCNLRCNYCDTKYAYDGGIQVSINELVTEWKRSGAAIAEITGGEPLMQCGFAELAAALRDSAEGRVLVETNGSLDISVIPDGVTAVIDVKCPGSGAGNSFYMPNIGKLRDYDELKFVISDRDDYIWAKRFTEEHRLTEKCHAVLFGAVDGRIAPGQLGEWIVADRLKVRLHLQLHKIAELA